MSFSFEIVCCISCKISFKFLSLYLLILLLPNYFHESCFYSIGAYYLVQRNVLWFLYYSENYKFRKQICFFIPGQGVFTNNVWGDLGKEGLQCRKSEGGDLGKADVIFYFKKFQFSDFFFLFLKLYLFLMELQAGKEKRCFGSLGGWIRTQSVLCYRQGIKSLSIFTLESTEPTLFSSRSCKVTDYYMP